MANDLKTKVTKKSVAKYIDAVKDEQRKKDSKKLLPLFKKWTKWNPKLWGNSIVGYGEYHYTYKSGREGDWPVTGFSPRKQALTIYIMPGLQKLQPELKKLGKCKTGVGCIYVKKLEDIDLKILEKMVKKGITDIKKMFPVKSS